MNNKYKKAGAWNLVCALLYVFSSLASSVLFYKDWLKPGDPIAAFLAIFIMVFDVAFGLVACVFPLFMTITGGIMLSGLKKRFLFTLLLIVNCILKLVAIVANGLWGYVFVALSPNFIMTKLGGVLLIAVAICMLVSIVLDIKGLFTKSEMLDEKE